MAEDKERSPQDSEEPAVLQRPLAPVGADSAVALLRPGDPGHAAYPVAEAEYWREMHPREPYYEVGRSFADYSTAYELGWVSYHRYGGEFDTAERVLANDWLVRKGVSTLTWGEARPAVRAAWQRAENARSLVSDGTASPEVVRQALADLFATVRDVELELREALSHAQAPELIAVFERLAQHYGAVAAELQPHIREWGGSVDEGGTVGGVAQRVWLQVRGLFGAASDHAMLAVSERGQDEVVARYREALQSNLPLDLHALVQRQFEQAQRQHDHIKRLRDRANAIGADQEQPA
jgi:uncharacterized protein (TIGR02284 family)